MQQQDAAKNQAIGCLGFIVIIVMIFGLMKMCSSQPDNKVVPETAPEIPSWVPPEGYTLAYTTRGNVPFGYRWLERKEYTCDTGDRCIGMEVITSKNCDHTFYAAISLLDKAGTNIGWTNDTAQSLPAGRKAKLVFSSYERGARSAELGETSCY